MLVTVQLYGHLQQFGEAHEFDVETIGEVFRALNAVYPDFKAYLITNDNQCYHIVVNDEAVSVEQLELRATDGMVVKIVPVVQGGDPVTLFVAGALEVSITTASMIVGAALSLTVSLIMTGVSALLTDRTTGKQAKQSNNVSFSSVTDTIQQGTIIPVAYGTSLCEVILASLKVTVTKNGQ